MNAPSDVAAPLIALALLGGLIFLLWWKWRVILAALGVLGLMFGLTGLRFWLDSLVKAGFLSPPVAVMLLYLPPLSLLLGLLWAHGMRGRGFLLLAAALVSLPGLLALATDWGDERHTLFSMFWTVVVLVAAKDLLWEDRPSFPAPDAFLSGHPAERGRHFRWGDDGSGYDGLFAGYREAADEPLRRDHEAWRRDGDAAGSKRSATYHRHLETLLIRLPVQAAGRTDGAKARLVLEFFRTQPGYGSAQRMQEVLDIIAAENGRPRRMAAALPELRANFAYATRLEVLALIFRLTPADEGPGTGLPQVIAARLGIRRADCARLEKRFRKQRAKGSASAASARPAGSGRAAASDSAADEKARRAAARHEHFVDLVLTILTAVAQTGGSLGAAETGAILHFFEHTLWYDAARLAEVRRRLEALARSGPGRADLDRALSRFRADFGLSSGRLLLELALRVAFASGPAPAARLALVREIAARLGVGEQVLRNLEARFRSGRPADWQDYARQEAAYEEQAGARSSRQEEARREEQARREQARREEASRRQRRRRALLTPEDERAFAVLGLPPDAPFSAARKAYRKLAHQYHPDTVSHLGEAYRRIATEKMQAINAAYGRLERKFGKE